MWPPSAGSSVSVEKLDSATVRSGLAWPEAGRAGDSDAAPRTSRDTTRPRDALIVRSPDRSRLRAGGGLDRVVRRRHELVHLGLADDQRRREEDGLLPAARHDAALGHLLQHPRPDLPL